ncbi:sugar phosphate isomerase/epimerase family protein [Aeoliella sp.]|uniref:sugar phosphate isomerase/epimerase family protein n=1 Tax=Aeoliella sp. TaxID=2795800 RepID=UPI003CCBCD3F
MQWGYNTNGLADHPLPAAIELVAELGYSAIAVTLDHHTINPLGDDLARQIAETRGLLTKHHLNSVVETGARYLLDPRHKHQPTMLSPEEGDRLRRVNMLRKSVDIANLLGAHCVSFWPGTPTDDAPRSEHLRRLVESLRPVIEHARKQGVMLAFEPEPGHLIDTMASYAELLEALPQELADSLRLTIDIGHLHCLGETPIAEQLTTWGDRLENVHIEDMRAGVHEHLPFGEGEIDFPPVIAALQAIEYRGPVTVELPRHSHIGPEMAEQSLSFLRQLRTES